MELTPQVVSDAEFREAKRGGYNIRDVDDFLDQVAVGVQRLHDQLREAYQRADMAESRAADMQQQVNAGSPAFPPPPVPGNPAAGGEGDEALRRTLALAQRTADATIKEAKDEAARLVEEARSEAARVRGGVGQAPPPAGMTVDAHAGLAARRDELEEQVRRLEQHLAAQQDNLRADVEEIRRLLDDPSASPAVPDWAPEPQPQDLSPANPFNGIGTDVSSNGNLGDPSPFGQPVGPVVNNGHQNDDVGAVPDADLVPGARLSSEAIWAAPEPDGGAAPSEAEGPFGTEPERPPMPAFDPPAFEPRSFDPLAFEPRAFEPPPELPPSRPEPEPEPRSSDAIPAFDGSLAPPEPAVEEPQPPANPLPAREPLPGREPLTAREPLPSRKPLPRRDGANVAALQELPGDEGRPLFPASLGGPQPATAPTGFLPDLAPTQPEGGAAPPADVGGPPPLFPEVPAEGLPGPFAAPPPPPPPAGLDNLQDAGGVPVDAAGGRPSAWGHAGFDEEGDDEHNGGTRFGRS